MNEFPFGDVIYSYTRAQAIEDGVLVDVTSVAREAGIGFPVAITRAVFEKCVAVSEGIEAQDESGRLWDILWMFRANLCRPRGDRCLFQLFVRNHNRARLTHRDRVTLKAICGPGDDAAPVITIMLPDED